MLGMGMMHDDDKEDQDVEAKLSVLEEIKQLMDTRLGDSLNPGHGVSVEKVSVEGSPSEEASESPAMEASEDEAKGPEMGGMDQDGMSDEEKEKLMSMYSGMK